MSMETEKRKEELKKLTISEFSEKAEQYDSDGMFERVKADYNEVIEEVQNESYNVLIDYGCGTGELLNRLYQIDSSKKYIGIDITPGILEVAKKKNQNIEYILGDSEATVVNVGNVDVVTCVHSFHHYTSPLSFLKKVRETLTTGGRLILRDNSSNSLVKYLFMNYFLYPIYHLRGKGDVHFYSRHEIIDLCKKADLTPERVEIRENNKLHCVIRKG